MAGAFGSDEEREDERGNSLPLFYRSDNGTRDSEFRGIQSRDEGPINPYVEMLESISPGEMVGQFMTTASPRVQTAVKNTIMGLLGSLRASPAFDTSIVTTQRAMASLMFQLEMTGYMFRNAEYRLSLQKSLLEALPPAMEEDSNVSPSVKGKITVTMSDGKEIEVDANAYVSELTREVKQLKSELLSLQKQNEMDDVQDILGFVQRLDNKEMQSLTSSVSPEVLDAMRKLVDTVIKGMGADPALMSQGIEIITEIPASTLAQLCMWQLVVGYNLREMEAREELNKRLPGAE